jgi:hypothetical protein
MKVLACAEFDADGTTCIAEVWVEQPDFMGGIFSMSVEDAEAIAWAVVYVWAIGLMFRLARKALD